jgi:hypothetical protein
MTNGGAVSDRTLETPLPADVEIERLIIAAALFDGSICGKLSDLLSRDDFHLDSHKFIYDALITLHQEGAPVSVHSVYNKLKDARRLEITGGFAYLSDTEDLGKGMDEPELEYYTGILKSKSLLRRLIKTSNQTMWRAWDEEDEAETILADAEAALARMSEYNELIGRPVLRSFGQFMATEFAHAEALGFDIRRRELCLIASITNRGKSTLLRNAAIAMATGGEFPPLVEKGKPRKVLLIDFETSGSRLQDDLANMTRDWPETEVDLLRENFFIVCEAMIIDEMLSLSRHLRVIERAARAHKVDVIMVDTASAAFDLRNENDNGEVAHVALKPLLKLARKLDCGILLAHHVGKIGSEEAKQAEKAYRARGASAWGCYPTSVFIITAHPTDKDKVTLTCAKRKDGLEYENVLELNRMSRWFKLTDEAPPPAPLTSREKVRAAVTREMQKAEIITVLKDSAIPVRTIENSLSKELAEGFLVSPKRGWYAPPEIPTSAISYRSGGTGKNGNSMGDGGRVVCCQSCGAAGLLHSHCNRCEEFLRDSSQNEG